MRLWCPCGGFNFSAVGAHDPLISSWCFVWCAARTENEKENNTKQCVSHCHVLTLPIRFRRIAISTNTRNCCSERNALIWTAVEGTNDRHSTFRDNVRPWSCCPRGRSRRVERESHWSLWFIWFLWFVWLLWFCVSLIFRSGNPMNETNSINQTNEMNQFGLSLRRRDSLQPQQSHESLRPRPTN